MVKAKQDDWEEWQYFECQCFSPEHTLRFWIDLDDGSITTSCFLRVQTPWYKRWWTALKYAFGHTSSYGHWDNFLLRFEDYDKVRQMLSHSEIARKNSETNYH